MNYQVYKITNHSNGRTYIGMTQTPFQHRFSRHINALTAGCHVNDLKQSDWNNGDRDFSVELMAVRGNKVAAKALETELMNLEDDPYNIAKGNPGDLNSRIGFKFNVNNRSYVYAEIISLKGVPQGALTQIYGIGQPMVSMIQNGHRTAPLPQTTFADCMSDSRVTVQAANPTPSNVLAIYKEQA
jgi:hypothetical protein